MVIAFVVEGRYAEENIPTQVSARWSLVSRCWSRHSPFSFNAWLPSKYYRVVAPGGEAVCACSSLKLVRFRPIRPCLCLFCCRRLACRGNISVPIEIRRGSARAPSAAFPPKWPERHDGSGRTFGKMPSRYDPKSCFGCVQLAVRWHVWLVSGIVCVL